ncbi:MAG: Re/Si-specific NAD(P)(+) transhydrogenase subunit alpha [Acidimicrobiales bacterium]
MRLGIPSETTSGERRVALVPSVVPRITALGADVAMQAGAGASSLLADEAYTAAGVTLVDAPTLFATSGFICKVQPLTLDEVGLMNEGAGVVSYLQPAANLDVVRALADHRISAFSLDLLPRISRAQSMDVLSSQALVSGYRAVLLAAEYLPKFFPLYMTAAGTVPPAKVLVLGAGVAGLQAIATARRLGANVRAYDVRDAARAEVKSLGATFVELDLETQEGEGGYAREQSEDFLRRQRELIGKEVAVADVVITTAAIPGRKAPVLVTAEMVHQMALGSVIVDLAAETGGNCELSRPGENLDEGGVTVIGVKNLPSSMPLHASFLYSRNVAEFLTLVIKAGAFAPDFDDEIVAGTCVTYGGEVRHAPTRDLLQGGTQ